jgi:antitoxin component of RelBE/YafQ-DinJ toxin-antitoxin module
MATTSNYALRLQASLKTEAEKLAEAEGTTLNQFINVAVAEKIAALKTLDYLKARAARSSAADALKALDEIGGDGPVLKGDET